jgi:hypothetical protein
LKVRQGVDGGRRRCVDGNNDDINNDDINNNNDINGRMTITITMISIRMTITNTIKQGNLS